MDTKQKKPGATRQSTAGGRKRSGTPVKNSPAAKSAARQRAKATAGTVTKTKKPTPDVVYTPARPFNRGRFLLKLLTVAAVVIAIVFGISIFFKVETVVVSGTNKYTPWQIREASGIQEGENLLTFGVPAASARIRSALPYVGDVRVGIQLPDTVLIDIVELEVVYSVEAEDGSWWLITSDGRVVEQATASGATAYTNIQGIKLLQPKQGVQAQAVTAEETEDTGAAIEEVDRADASLRLSAALTIVQYLEAYGIIGQASSVDVGNITDLQLWYGQQYQVLLGDVSQMSRKIEAMKLAIDQMDDYQSGILDVSFTLWPDQPSYKPF